jgi:hypothetical protein
MRATTLRCTLEWRVVAGLLLTLAVVPALGGGVRGDGSVSALAGASSRLPLAAEATISRVLGRDGDVFRATATERGLTLRNPGEHLVARFRPAGVDLTSRSLHLRLSLRAWGYGGSLRSLPPAQPQAVANRVTYRRGPVSEWYANGPLGLEQGFTLQAPQRRRGTGPLTLAIALASDATALLTPDHAGLRFAGSQLRYQGLVASDARGRRLHAWLELGSQRLLLLRVAEAGARYPLTIDPFVQQAKLTASDGQPYTVLGFGVGVSGDTIAAASYPSTIGGNSFQGAIYVFVKPPTGWANATETAKLTASDGAAGDWLGGVSGQGVGIGGDTIVAGAPNADVDGNANEGAAYVFVKPATGWVSGHETAKLTASDGFAGMQLGTMVAVDGDTAVVGGSQHGAAYVFARPPSGWASAHEAAKLTPSDQTIGNQFPTSVAASGETIVVGAEAADGHELYAGAAYAFTKPPSGWVDGTETAKLTASDGTRSAIFGNAVAISGETAVVGAPQAPVTYGNQGAVYVFVKPPTGWAGGSQAAKLTASDGGSNYQLGHAVGVSGDTVVAYGPTPPSYEGGVYVYLKPTTGWANGTETQKLLPANEFQDQFGRSLGISGGTIVADALGATVGGNPGQGAVYVFGRQAPTAASLLSFAGRRTHAGALVRWRIAATVGLLGFNLYRESRGRWLKLNSALIPENNLGTTRGQVHSWLDRSARARTESLRYRLEVVTAGGVRYLLGTANLR